MYRSIMFASVIAVSACAKSEAIRTSGNNFVLQTSAAPICGPTGAARVASQMAAVETLRAGYDRYIIFNGSSANNVSLVQGGGTSRSSGSLTYGGGYGNYSGRTTYTPGPVFEMGTHDQSLTVQMYRDSEPDAKNAISAREALGPEWADKVKSGVNTCG